MTINVENSFTTEKAHDYAMLSEMAYANWSLNGIPDDNTTIWKQLSRVKGYLFVAQYTDYDTGYSGTIFLDTTTNKYILANRGTELKTALILPVEVDPHDLYADGEIAAGTAPAEQFSSMVQFIEQYNLTTVQFDVTGHSLGGCLAQMAKAAYSSNIDEVYTYNAPGAKNLARKYYYVGAAATPGKVVMSDGFGIEVEWTDAQWNRYESYLANKGTTIIADKVYNISAKDSASAISDTGTDIGKEVFINGATHSISDATKSITEGIYVDSKSPVTIIGSKANEVIKANYDSGHYNGNAQSGTLVGGYGSDVIYAGDAGSEIYGDLPQEIIGDANAMNKTGNAGGTAGNDVLYGGAGSDTIYGGGGDDKLNGGKGNDTLYGGTGCDTYFYQTGDGNDVIVDEDKKGRIVVQNSLFPYNSIIFGNLFGSGTTWSDPTGTIQFSANTITLSDGSTISIQDFQSGDFSINLIDVPENPRQYSYADITNTIVGDLTPIDFDPDTEGIQPHYDEWGNVLLVDPEQPDPGWYDVLHDTTGNDQIEGRDGNDIIYVNHGGDDRVSGGNGDDEIMSGGPGNDQIDCGAGDDLVQASNTGILWIQGGDGNDALDANSSVNCLIEGGSGSDIIFGSNAGNNRLFGDSYGEMETLIANGETAQDSGLKGDIIVVANATENYIYGSNGYDILLGGWGKDLIVGGGGDDLIESDSETGMTAGTAETYTWGYTINVASGGEGTTYTPVITGITNYFAPHIDGADDVVYAGTGNDFVLAGAGDDEVYGGAGIDTIFGEAGDDFIEGGDGDDILIGDNQYTSLPIEQHGNDYIDGGAGNDQIEGYGGSDDLFGGEGNDTIYGDGTGDSSVYFGDDYIDGEDGDDILIGAGGSDEIFGGDGNDLLAGDADNVLVIDHGDDYLDGEAGDDTLWGYGGSDTLYGGAGNDALYGDSDIDLAYQGDDYLDGEAGDDILFGYGGNDTLIGGDGNDTLYGGDGNNYFDAGEGNNIVVAGVGDDEIYAGSGNDQIQADDGNDYIDGGNGNNTITGGAGNDVILAGDGADSIWGGTGDDEIYAGAGNDVLYDEGGNSIIFGEDGDDRIETADGDGYLDGGAGNDIIIAGNGNDTVYGGVGDDYLQGDVNSSGNDYLSGDDGNDSILAGGGDDSLFGGSGDDYLDGGVGNDVYRFDSGDGYDRIYNAASDNAETTDVLEFGEGISIDKMSFIKQSGDLCIAFWESDDGIRLANWFSSPESRVDRFVFADGSELNSDQLAQIGFTVNGTAGSDTISGGAGADSLNGQGGSDVLIGGAGDDVYIFNVGAGSDTIQDSETGADKNVIRFGDEILPEELTVTAPDNNTLIIHYDGYGDKITLARDEDGKLPVSMLRYSDGSEISISNPIWGTNGDDAITVPENSDDLIFAGAGNDNIVSGAGDDAIYGGAGADCLNGESGNDIMLGGMGSDTYYFGLGSGQDKIIDMSEGEGTINRIVLTAGVSVDDLIIERSYNDVKLNINGTEDFVVLSKWYDRDSIDLITDENGATIDTDAFWNMDDIVYGTQADDALNGFAGDDTLYGYAGNDYLSGDEGDDILYGGGGWDDLMGGEGNDELYGGDGNDVLRDYYGNNLFDGGSGNDILSGVGGSNTYVFGLGYGIDSIASHPLYNRENELPVGKDTVVFGEWVTPDNIIVGSNLPSAVRYGGHAYSIDIACSEQDVARITNFMPETYPSQGYPDNITDFGVTRFVFNDGSVLNLEDILALSDRPDGWGDESWEWYDDPLSIRGSSMDDMLQDTDGDDDIYALEGNDTISASAGNDYLSGGIGDDLITGGVGCDIFIGGPGADSLYGEADNDIMMSGKGNDLMAGGAGDDNYIYYRGDGADTIQDVSTALEGNSLLFGDIYYEDIQGKIEVTDSAAIIRIGDGDEITLTGIDPETLLPTSHAVDIIGFADGQVMTFADLIAGNNPIIRGTDGDDILEGTSLDNIMEGYEGNDVLNGYDGNDTINGGAGDDTIDGGRGCDTLDGGDGHDIYVYGPGDGTDIIYDNDTKVIIYNINDGNILRFKNGITPSDLKLQLGSLLIRVGDNGDAIHLMNFDPNDARGPRTINFFEFSDGTVLTYDQLIDRGFDLDGSSGNDILRGTDVVDRIVSFGGDDQISSGDGDDVINGGTGSDSLIGGSGNDTYVFNLGDGVDTIIDVSTAVEGNKILFGEGVMAESLTFVRNGSVLTINYGNNGDSINLMNFDQDEIAGSLVVRTLQFADGSQANLTDFLNRAPVVSNPLAEQSTMEDETFSFTVPATTFADPDEGDTLTCSATLADGSALPSWLTFDPSTMTFSGMSSNDDVGILALKVTATDTSGASVSDVFNVTVLNVNDPPVIANPIADLSTMADAAFNFTVPAGTFTDVDAGDTLTYSATLSDGTNLPSWLTFDPATMTFSGMPNNDNVGVLSLNVAVTDSAGASTSDSFKLTIQTNLKTTYGTNGTDMIITGNDNDLIYALGGIDFVYSGGGNDRIYGGDGIDLLCGDGGNDMIDGGAGADVMLGCTGDDTYYVDNVYDTVIELYNEGTDTVMSSVTYTLGANVENLTLMRGTSIINGTGNALDNIITGNNANNILNGNAGNDTLNGGAGHDTLVGGSGNDTYFFANGSGTDIVTDSGADSSTQDLIKFQSNVLKESITIFQGTSDLSIAYGDTDKITVTSQTSSSYGIEKVQLDNGQYMTATDINQLIQNMATFATAHNLAFSSVNDVKASTDLMSMVAGAWHS